mmetsp:Transcript_16454/g.53659  ORF Transcript_16454/g.53659 Transcript_16454/m.53659 type:complete len:202 (-) Transcript_16454:317-922(-)
MRQPSWPPQESPSGGGCSRGSHPHPLRRHPLRRRRRHRRPFRSAPTRRRRRRPARTAPTRRLHLLCRHRRPHCRGHPPRTTWRASRCLLRRRRLRRRLRPTRISARSKYPPRHRAARRWRSSSRWLLASSSVAVSASCYCSSPCAETVPARACARASAAAGHPVATRTMPPPARTITISRHFKPRLHPRLGARHPLRSQPT